MSHHVWGCECMCECKCVLVMVQLLAGTSKQIKGFSLKLHTPHQPSCVRFGFKNSCHLLFTNVCTKALACYTVRNDFPWHWICTRNPRPLAQSRQHNMVPPTMANFTVEVFKNEPGHMMVLGKNHRTLCFLWHGHFVQPITHSQNFLVQFWVKLVDWALFLDIQISIPESCDLFWEGLCLTEAHNCGLCICQVIQGEFMSTNGFSEWLHFSFNQWSVFVFVWLLSLYFDSCILSVLAQL